MFKTIYLFLLMFKLLTAQTGVFHMTDMIQTPSPVSGVTTENSTVSLYGISSDKWTISELYFSDKILCRSFPGSGTCGSDVNYSTIRMGGVNVLVVNETTCGYELPYISSPETGKWKIRMGKLVNGVMGWDYMEETLKVSQQSSVTLSPLPSSNIVYQNSSYLSCHPGTSLAITCAAGGGRPEVDSFTWEMSNIVYWDVEYGDVLYTGQDGWGFRDSIQRVDMFTDRLGVYTLMCTPAQTGYEIEPASLIIDVISEDDETVSPSSKMHPFTITFIVLGCVFFIIIIILVIITFFTRTLCFSEAQPKEKVNKEPKLKKQKKQKVKKSKEEYEDTNTVVMDTSYVVGQDYQQNNQNFTPASNYFREHSPSISSLSLASDDLNPTIYPAGRGGKVY